MDGAKDTITLTMHSKAINLTRGQNAKIAEIYPRIAAQISDEARGSRLVLDGWRVFDQNFDRNDQGIRPISGKVFEYLVIDAIWHHCVKPIYYQAKVAQIPLTVYDVFLYHPTTPVTISCKVSLGERWKQADLEGTALRQVYRGAHNVLLTMHPDGHKRQRETEERTIVGLDQCIVIEEGNDDFDNLLVKLADMDLQEARPTLPVEGALLV